MNLRADTVPFACLLEPLTLPSPHARLRAAMATVPVWARDCWPQSLQALWLPADPKPPACLRLQAAQGPEGHAAMERLTSSLMTMLQDMAATHGLVRHHQSSLVHAVCHLPLSAIIPCFELNTLAHAYISLYLCSISAHLCFSMIILMSSPCNSHCIVRTVQLPFSRRSPLHSPLLSLFPHCFNGSLFAHHPLLF